MGHLIVLKEQTRHCPYNNQAAGGMR
jgi:hypothetical protein